KVTFNAVNYSEDEEISPSVIQKTQHLAGFLQRFEWGNPNLHVTTHKDGRITIAYNNIFNHIFDEVTPDHLQALQERLIAAGASLLVHSPHHPLTPPESPRTQSPRTQGFTPTFAD